jgi:nanoRNase/pAp phosphatase (c-di-AMP/oligoRNAs hydrolase)
MDPRTGLGRYRDYRISNYQLMEDMIELCRSLGAEEILALPDVQERVKRYYEHVPLFKKMLLDNSEVHEHLVVTDLREVEEIYCGNRFMLYTLYPDCNISMQVMWGMQKQNVVVTLGYSILNRTCKLNVGSLMLKYGGGGHPQVGTCQIPLDRSESVLEEIISVVVDMNK